MKSITPLPKSKYNWRILSGSNLKIIAIALMIIDHIGAVVIFHGYLLPNVPVLQGTFAYSIYTFYQVLRFIGRSAFPIFCFLLVQGFLHTSNKRKYLTRLFIFALISEIPFDIAIHNAFISFGSQNIFFTLLIGFCVMWLMELWADKLYLQLLIVALGMGLAYLIQSDYDYWGILLISILYFFRTTPVLQTIVGSLALLWEAPATIAFIPINMYNGKRGIPMKYFFYIFYPAHLLLLVLIRYLIFGM